MFITYGSPVFPVLFDYCFSWQTDLGRKSFRTSSQCSLYDVLFVTECYACSEQSRFYFHIKCCDNLNGATGIKIKSALLHPCPTKWKRLMQGCPEPSFSRSLGHWSAQAPSEPRLASDWPFCVRHALLGHVCFSITVQLRATLLKTVLFTPHLFFWGSHCLTWSSSAGTELKDMLQLLMVTGSLCACCS